MEWIKVLAVLFMAACLTAESFYIESSNERLVDLTHPFDPSTLGYPDLKKFKLKVNHNGTTDEGFWLQIEDYESSIHAGTHMDAPCHIMEGQWCLDKIPLHRFLSKAVVVDITQRANLDPDANLEVQDIIQWERMYGRIPDGTVVLVNSGWGKKWSDPEAFLGTTTGDVSKIHFPGISEAAARFLAQTRNVFGVGIDTTSLDNGQAKKRKAHEALFAANIYGLENVANLDKLPPYGATLMLMPMKITNASGAPVRIIAMLP